MTSAFVDTNILIHLFRRNPAAISWFATQQDLAITSVSWLEFIQGAPGKSGQAKCLQIMTQFNMEYLTLGDQQWAMEELLHYRLSHGVNFQDCLIASVVHRLQIPLYTQNVKDFWAVLPKSLVIKPY